MSVPQWAVFLLCLSGVSSFAVPVHAALEVTEIMYNPVGANTGHQWIELTNTGLDAIDLGGKDTRFFDAKGNHIVKPYGAGGTTIAPNTVAIIAQNPLTFLNDFPSYVGILLKSSFTLTSTGIVGVSQTDGTILTKASYDSAMGAAGDGNSLQFAQGSAPSQLKPAAPTPGEFPATLPGKIIPPVKPTATKSSSNGRARSSPKSSKKLTNTYGKGTVAPPASADAAVGGALSDFSFPTIPLPSFPVFASPWFAAFLGLLAFSGFSLILIQRNQYL